MNPTGTCTIKKVLIPVDTQTTHEINLTICRILYTFTYFRLFRDYLVFRIIFHIIDCTGNKFF